MRVTISISDPILRDYVRYKYEKNKEGLPIAGNGTLSGVVLCSSVSISHVAVPVKEPADTLITFAIANVIENKHLKNHFLYIPVTRKATIKRALEKEFDCDFFYFIAQCSRNGYKIKESIEMFILQYNLESAKAVFENLKKKEYRDRQYAEKTYQKLLKKAYWKVYTPKNQP